MTTFLENVEMSNNSHDASNLFGENLLLSDSGNCLKVVTIDESERSTSSDNRNFEFKDGNSSNLDNGYLLMLPDGTFLGVYDDSVESLDSSKECASTTKPKPSKKGSSQKLTKSHSKSAAEFKCSVQSCGKIYFSLTDLKTHRKVHSGLSSHFCEYCSRKFATGYGLKSHKRTHTGEKPYNCPELACNKKFNTSGDLQKHIRTHTGERPFHCEICSKSFTTSNIRKVHMRIHTGEKPYQCHHEGCNRKFSSATNYRNHTRIHTGEKPYVCSFEKCQRRFTEYSSLYKHYLVHTERKNHVCSICSRQFKQLTSLNVHMNSMHKDVSISSKDKCSIERSSVIKTWDGLMVAGASSKIVVDEPLVNTDTETSRTNAITFKPIRADTKAAEAILVLAVSTAENGPPFVFKDDVTCTTDLSVSSKPKNVS